jgi:SlyX protein
MTDEIIDLQTRMAFQDGVIEELNDVVTRQQKQIERLESQLAGLKSQFEGLQHTLLAKPADEPPPPHY